MVLGRQLRLPAVLDHDSLVRLNDDGGAGDLVARREQIAREYAGVVPVPAGEEARAPRWRGQGRVGDGLRRLGEFRAAADGFDRHRFDDKLLRGVDEAETRQMRGLEGGLHLFNRHSGRRRRRRSGIDNPGLWIWISGLAAARLTRNDGIGGNDQRRVGAGVTDVGSDMHGDIACRHALAFDFLPRRFAETPSGGLDRSPARPDRSLLRPPAGAWRGYRRGPCHRPTTATTADE